MSSLPAAKPLRAGAVASPHRAATAAGEQVLASGGNAVDAAIATNAMLAVVYPHMCGPGGDLFLLHFEARTGIVHCLNGTGGAPALATRDEFRRRGMDAVPARGPLSLTVPGAVAAWESAVARFGTRTLCELLTPAIEAADHGVEVSARLAGWIAAEQADIRTDPALRDWLLDEAGRPLAPGATIRSQALADTLRQLAAAGAADLYRGDLARRLVAAVAAADGLLGIDDLRTFVPEWVAPVAIPVGDLEVVTTPPNSQGITALLMLKAMGTSRQPGSIAYVDAFIPAKLRAFAARDAHVTDPRHMSATTEEILAGAAPARPTAPAPVSGDTVYVCAVDAEGNACSLIQSIYYGFGSCFIAGDTGILMHNRAHYFSLDPAAPNALEPAKRTLHTLMACMAMKDGRPRFVFGTMGADGQPQTNVQVFHRLVAGDDPADAVAAPRILHGRFALEDDARTLHVEADYGPADPATMVERYPSVEIVPAASERLGHAHAIAVDAEGGVTAGADPRSDGSAAVVMT